MSAPIELQDPLRMASALRASVPTAILRMGEEVSRRGGELYVVGGWVRDRLLGGAPDEMDLTTSLPTDILREVLTKASGTVRETGLRYGTLSTSFDGLPVEVTSYRSERYRPGSRHPEIALISDIEGDLGRRDFTINAIALPVAGDDEPVVDPFGGITDLRNGLIRTPGDPDARMKEDPLRMLRAVRFHGQLGFAIDDHLYGALTRNAGMLHIISAERKRDEFEKLLISDGAASGIRMLVRTGLMQEISPEISAMDGVEQPLSCHRADVLEHTLLTIMYLPPVPLLRRAALFHDVGKPATAVTEPKRRFPGHDRIGSEMTERIMRQLRYSNREIEKTAFMVRMHMRPIYYSDEWGDSAVRRAVHDCTLRDGDGNPLVGIEEILRLARADILAGNEDVAPIFIKAIERFEERANHLMQGSTVKPPDSPIGGEEIMRLLGVGPGPHVGAVKAYLKRLVMEGELGESDVEQARILAKKYHGGRQGETVR